MDALAGALEHGVTGCLGQPVDLQRPGGAGAAPGRWRGRGGHGRARSATTGRAPASGGCGPGSTPTRAAGAAIGAVRSTKSLMSRLMSTGSRAGTPWPPPSTVRNDPPVSSASRSPSAWGRMWSSLPCIDEHRAADLRQTRLDLGRLRAEQVPGLDGGHQRRRVGLATPARRSPRSASWSAARRTSRSKKNCRKSS